MELQTRSKLAAVFVVSAIAAASVWFYFDRILVAHQVADAVAHDRPRGNLSDLYPRWLGARELLLHGRNPYSDDVTMEIQEGYYGRRLDASRPNDPKDQQGFAYPVYVVFLLAPLIGLPFHTVQILFYWALIGLSGLSVWLWLRAVNWRLQTIGMVICAVLVMGSIPAVQGIKLQQLTLLVSALLAGSAACVASGWLFCGGVLLALGTIKPQLAWLLGLWLLIWTLADWRGRRRFLYGFGFMMAVLLAGARVMLRGWVWMFAQSLAQYHRYTQNASVLDQLVPWWRGGQLLALLAVIACLPWLWKSRVAKIDSREFGDAIALLMALTVLIVPMYAPYNQVLLLPAALLLVRDRTVLISKSTAWLLVFVAGALALCWQWITSLALSAVYELVSPAWAISGWKWPFFTTFALPVLVFVLMLELARMRYQRSLIVRQQE